MNARIVSNVRIYGNGKLSIGNNTWIGHDVFILSSSPAHIEIGNNVDIVPRVFIGTGSHVINPNSDRVAGKGTSQDIVIEDGALVGACTTILLDVRIGNMSIVAAGSFVNKDVPPYTIVGGAPARIIRDLKNAAKLQ